MQARTDKTKASLTELTIDNILVLDDFKIEINCENGVSKYYDFQPNKDFDMFATEETAKVFSSESWYLGCLLHKMCYLSNPNVQKIKKGKLPILSAYYEQQIEELLKELLNHRISPEKVMKKKDQFINRVLY